jgi:hypothetical protein
MICRNCGWSNPEGATSCEKCKQPLETAQPAETSPKPSEQPQPVQENLRKTIRENTYEPQQDESAAPQGNACPKCGYPLAEGCECCPSCGAEIAPAKPEKPMARNATINPWARRDNFCKLTPIDWNGEPMPVDGPVQEFQDGVVLNRSNTMPDNKAITSQAQAELVFKDGHWTIVDRSEQHTTFVVAGREIELQNGDVVMLGNQLFRFKDGNAE